MDLVARYLSDSTHLSFSFILSPDDFGVPCTRHRRISIVVGRWMIPTLLAVPRPLADSSDMEQLYLWAPDSLFGHDLVTDGVEMFFAAPAELVQNHMSKLAVDVGSSLSSPRPRDLLALHLQCHLERYELALKHNSADAVDAIFDMHQDPHRLNPAESPNSISKVLA